VRVCVDLMAHNRRFRSKLLQVDKGVPILGRLQYVRGLLSRFSRHQTTALRATLASFSTVRRSDGRLG